MKPLFKLKKKKKKKKKKLNRLSDGQRIYEYYIKGKGKCYFFFFFLKKKITV